jgi:radical SAM-linked protein
MQRLRVRFGRGEEIKFISHLDIMRLWERAIHRARIPLAYSEGFSPHPRLSLAVPLAVGVTSETELMDIFIARLVSPHWFTAAVGKQLPAGIEILGAYQIGLNIPSLQSQVRYAEYRVEVERTDGPENVESAIVTLLSAKYLMWHHQRDTGRRNYDLRALIDDLWLNDSNQPFYTIGMRLRCDSGGSGRPEQVILALGFTYHPQSIHRTRLVIEAQR